MPSHVMTSLIFTAEVAIDAARCSIWLHMLAVTCRAESLKLEQIADRLDALGVRRCCIVHEYVSASA